MLIFSLTTSVQLSLVAMSDKYMFQIVEWLAPFNFSNNISYPLRYITK